MSNVGYNGGLGDNGQFQNRWTDNIGGTGTNPDDIFRSPDFITVMYMAPDGVFNSNLKLPALSLSTSIVVKPDKLVQFKRVVTI